MKSIQGNFLCSLLSAVDGSLWQSSKDTRLRPEQGLLSLKYHAFWALGENVCTLSSHITILYLLYF